MLVRSLEHGLITERDLEVRIDLTVGKTQFGLTFEKDSQLRDLQLRLYCLFEIGFLDVRLSLPKECIPCAVQVPWK